ncbi:hypothetical protein BH23BAC3_BH23BAC3_07560 [soil metagenome]
MSIPKIITISDLMDKFEGAKTVIHEYGNLDKETVTFKLNPETWNCVEICQHLIRFNDLYLSEMDLGLEKLKTIPVNGNSFSPAWTVRKLAGYFEPPYKFGVKTIRPMLPSNTEMETAETFMRLIGYQDEIISRLEKAKVEHWNLDKIKGRHPLLTFIRMSYIDFLILIDAHQRRHFWQFEQILKRMPG